MGYREKTKQAFKEMQAKHDTERAHTAQVAEDALKAMQNKHVQELEASQAKCSSKDEEMRRAFAEIERLKMQIHTFKETQMPRCESQRSERTGCDQWLEATAENKEISCRVIEPPQQNKQALLGLVHDFSELRDTTDALQTNLESLHHTLRGRAAIEESKLTAIKENRLREGAEMSMLLHGNGRRYEVKASFDADAISIGNTRFLYRRIYRVHRGDASLFCGDPCENCCVTILSAKGAILLQAAGEAQRDEFARFVGERADVSWDE